MQYKGMNKALPQIARELGVDAVLEGSVKRSGQRVRVAAQLVDAGNDQHLWAQRYDRDVGEVLILQGEISRAIADEIRIKLTPQRETQRAQNSRVDPQVEEDYLKGRYHLNKGSQEEVGKGIQFFEHVLTRNPKDARGYAGLADSYVAFSDYYVPPAEILPKAKSASLKALELDDNLAEAHTSSGVVRFLYDWDWAGAEIEFKRAIELNPSSADARVWYAVFLAQMERGSEAIAELKRAEALDPLSLPVHVNAGWVYYLLRQNEQAIEQWRKALDLEPQFAVSHSAIWVGYLRSPDFARVMAALGKGASGDDPMELAALGGLYAVSGDTAQARAVLSKLRAMSKRRYVCPYEMATTHAVLGDKDEAIAYLSRGYQEHSACIPDIKTDPRLDSLRSDLRFQELLRKVGFRP
jgi:tetratricopeptide (TPR) repeat protein